MVWGRFGLSEWPSKESSSYMGVLWRPVTKIYSAAAAVVSHEHDS